MTRRPSPLDISWFLDLRNNKQIIVDPPYQRRSVWNLKDRRFFLDTIFRGYPSPPIFLHKTQGEDERTAYAVVDGKQRLMTMFQFVDGTITLDENFGDVRFNGKTWSELHGDEKKIFWDYVVSVEFLTFEENDTRAVNGAFDRLNRNMRKLDPQELRHARWDGWFIKLIEKECDEEAWKTLGITTNARAKRMKDAQFISELVLIIIDGEQRGFSQDALDAAYAKYDDPEEAEPPIEPDAVSDRLADAKRFLLEVQKHEPEAIKAAARTLAAFHTLWALIVTQRDKLPEPQKFASIFARFMANVTELRNAEDVATLIKGPKTRAYMPPFEFYQALGGASTDLAPRNKRLQSLLRFVQEQLA